MTSQEILDALDLPDSCRVNQRVPKKLLIENGARTAADKRHITEGIEELLWVAALKPATIGVPEYRDSVREYLEIAVLRLTLRAGARTARLVERVHRAIPYPVFLLTEHEAQIGLSAVHKRWSQAEAGKTILEETVISVDFGTGQNAECWVPFRDSLALAQQPRASLYALYQGWTDRLIALKAACVTGTFHLFVDAERNAERQVALNEYARLEKEIARLRAAAKKEKQMARKVELNLELKHVEAWLVAERNKL